MLDETDKLLLNNFLMVEVEGKCHNVVPILVSTNIQKGIKCLIEHRISAKINPPNSFIFAAGKNSLKSIRGPDAIRQARQKIPLQKPNTITATQLRKHIATASQCIDMTENQQDSLATHMGHDIKTH